MIILHVTPIATWERARVEGMYSGDSPAAEGFIHGCSADQLAGVVGRYFQGQTGLIVLKIESERLTAPLKWERAPGSDETFPHIYGPLNLDAVIGAEPLAESRGSRSRP